MEQTAKYEGSIPTLARRAGALGQLGHLSVLSLFVEQGSDDHLQWGGGGVGSPVVSSGCSLKASFLFFLPACVFRVCVPQWAVGTGCFGPRGGDFHSGRGIEQLRPTVLGRPPPALIGGRIRM